MVDRPKITDRSNLHCNGYQRVPKAKIPPLKTWYSGVGRTQSMRERWCEAETLPRWISSLKPVETGAAPNIPT